MTAAKNKGLSAPFKIESLFPESVDCAKEFGYKNRKGGVSMAHSRFDQVPETALEWYRDGGAGIATVVQTWGSAPRPTGSQLAISGNGEIAGSVSGGCVEGAVIAEALEAMETGDPRIVEFGVSDEDAFAVGLACGGKIRILVESIGNGDGLSESLLEQIVMARRNRKAVALMTDTVNWKRKIAWPRGVSAGNDLGVRFRLDQSGFEGEWFVNIYNPPLRMIVVGGVHIAQPLLKMARISGFDTVLIDPREAFASKSRFPDERIIYDWPDEAVLAEAPDSGTAVVTLTHDPKIDDPAILATLQTDAFYLGCLGSKRTHAKRLERLKTEGVEAGKIRRIDAPVGLDIGARSPSEIAIAIMAEITLRLRKEPSAA